MTRCCCPCGATSNLKRLRGYSGDVLGCTACRIVIALEEAGAAAWDAGQDPESCPFPAGTTHRERWLDGYRHAQDFEARWAYEAEMECAG